MYNKVIMLGRICNDLELKTTTSGVTVLTFSIACDRRWQEKGEERKADFFNCVAWRNEAEFIAKFWSKGRAILIEGELQNRKYTDKNNIERQTTEIIIDRACFTGEKSDKSGNRPPLPDEPPPRPSKSEAQDKPLKAEDFAKAPADEDYPF